MTQQVRRFGLTRSSHPGLVGAVVVGLAMLAVGFKTENFAVLGLGAVVYTAGILLLARPVLSVLLGILGIGGGIVTFFLVPNPDMAAAPGTTKALATLLFSALYLCLMNTLILIGAALYNFMVQTVGLRGITVQYASDEEEPAES